jgi:hypothetical protein
MYGWFMLRVSIYLSIYLFNIDFRACAYEISLSRFYVHLMYIKVISVPELSARGAHGIVRSDDVWVSKRPSRPMYGV